MTSPPVKLAFTSFEPEGGADELPPIIFIHGILGSKEFWEKVPQTVADATKRKAYAIDARNHGDTEWTEDFTFDSVVDDLLHFMDSIDVPKAILVGHSMGGTIGIKTALKCPERVEKLVVEDIGIKNLPKPLMDMTLLGVSLVTKALETMPAGLDEESSKDFVAEFVLESLPAEVKNMNMKRKPTDRLTLLLKRTEDGLYALKSNVPVLVEAMQKPETIIAEPTDVYDGPTGFIYGKLSPFPVDQDADLIKQHFPKAEFLGVENEVLNIHFDCPEEFNKMILKFLSEE